MRKIILLLATLPVFAFAQGLSVTAPRVTASGGKVLASFPLVTSGPLIVEDANTVAHVYWNGTALVDSKGNAWTENGTVPQVTANPFTTTRYGAGPFSAANYYSSATAPIGFPGDFTVCAVVDNPGSNLVIAYKGAYGASGSGWVLFSWTSSRVQLATYGPGSTSAAAVASVNFSYGAVNVICGGRSGTNIYAKVNGGTTGTAASAPVTEGTPSAQIGAGAGLGVFTGTIYEVYATTTPWSEATVTAIQQKVLGHFDGSSELAVTRATTATYAPRAADPSTLFTVPAGVARITDEGLLVEPARTNYALQSNTISAANAFNVNWIEWPDTTVVNVTTTATAAPGGGVWHTITNEAGGTSNVGQAYQTVTTASSTTFVASAWMKKPTGEDTTHAGIHVGCGAGTPSACTCVRSDGGSCTASTVATNYCQALVADLSTTPVRVSAKVTCSGAITSSIVALVPGNYGSSIGITDFTGVQHEIPGAEQGPSSLIVTTTTAVTRNSDRVSATVPAVPSKWCIAATAAPGSISSMATRGDSVLWWLGATGANTAIAYFTSTNRLVHTVTDASNTAKSLVYSSGIAGLTATRVTACSPMSTTSITVSGVSGLPTLSGTGAGILTTPPTTLHFGVTNSGANFLGGFLSNVKVCKATKPKECP